MDASEGEQHEVIDHLIICIIHSCLPWDQILREEIHRSLKEHGLRRLRSNPSSHLLYTLRLGHLISLHFQFSLCKVEKMIHIML